MQPLISIIVPVYNGQDYLENCIESIELQTYPALEVLIVNDGSTDATGKICEDLSVKYHNIQVISMNDEGVSKARNAGIERCKGEYVMFVDADDRLHCDTVQTLYDALVETESDMSGCGFFTWSSEQEWKEKVGIEKGAIGKPVIMQRDEFLEKGILGADTRCWGKLYKRSLIGEHRFRSGLTIGEDMLFLLDILPDMKKMVSVSFRGYGYYQNPEGAMNRKFTAAFMDQITCWELARDQIMQTDCGLKSQITAIILISIMLTAGKLSFLSAGERKENKKYIVTCQEKLMKELQVEGAYDRLSAGYKIKTRFFARMPQLYLWLYHFRKYFR